MPEYKCVFVKEDKETVIDESETKIIFSDSPESAAKTYEGESNQHGIHPGPYISVKNLFGAHIGTFQNSQFNQEAVTKFAKDQIEANTLRGELIELRASSRYSYCRNLIRIVTVIQWLLVGACLIASVVYLDSVSSANRETGTILLISSVIIGVLNPYVTQLTHIPFDIADLLFDIRKNSK